MSNYAYMSLMWAAYAINFTIVYCDQRPGGSGPAPIAGGIVPV